MSLGPHITIARQLNDRDYYCRSAIENAIFLAHVDPEFREEIADKYSAGGTEQNSHTDKKPCIFLRKKPDGSGTVCAIYPSRPKVCRDFRCYCMLILNREGKVCGKVSGKTALSTGDEALRNLWTGQIEAIPSGDAAAWMKKVAEILSENNYHADTIE